MMTNKNLSVNVTNLSKFFKLYDRPVDRIKEAFHPLSKKYHHHFYALKNVSLSVERGQSIGIIGRNGSGKSTLLKVISGVLTPSSGDVVTQGNISSLLELGIGFNPELTGIENIYFNGLIRGFSQKETQKKVQEIIDFAEIGEFIHQPVKIYSSGMFVRLAFSVAIHTDPDILIVDEALSVGDAGFSIKCIQKIKSFKNAGKTILFVSHDPGAVKTLCDYCYLLDKGEIIDHGAPDKVFDFYNHLISLQGAAANSLNSENDKEIARKRTGNGKLIFQKIQFLNSQGLATDSFISGEEVTLEMHLQANESIDSPTIGMMIRDRLGNDIFGTNSYLLQIDTGVLKKGSFYVVRYKFPLNLGQNVYSMAISAHSGVAHIEDCYDWINQAVVFKVVPSSDFQFVGYCRIQPQFEFTAV